MKPYGQIKRAPGLVTSCEALKSRSDGVHNLIRPLTINSISVSPSLVLCGGDASASGWSTRSYPATPVTAALQAGTAPSYNQGSPWHGPLDAGVQFNSGGYYAFSDASIGDVASEDFVLVVVARAPASGSALNIRLASKISTVGWEISTSRSTGSGTLTLNDGVHSAVYCAFSVTLGAINCLAFFVDRSGSAVCYKNGVAGTPVDVSSLTSLTTAANLTLGAKSDGTGLYNSTCYYLALYKRASWLDTHLQANLAAELTARLTGHYPSKAKGTALPAVLESRTTVGFSRKVEADGTSRMYLMGERLPRAASVKDSGGTARWGRRGEAASSNTYPYSQLLVNWTKAGCDSPAGSQDVALAPDGTMTADGVVCTAVAEAHRIRAAASVTNGVANCWSVFAKAGTASKIMLYNTQDANCTAKFDLAAGARGDIGSSILDANIEPWGNGWYRCWCAFTGGAAVTAFHYILNTSDWGIAWTADGTSNAVYLWGAQMEVGRAPTSYIVVPSTAPVQRTADGFRLAGEGNLGGVGSNQRGGLSFRMMMPAFTPSAAHELIELNDGGSSSDRIRLYVSTDGYVHLDSAATGGNAGAVQVNRAVCDGASHLVRAKWINNRLALSVDGVAGTPDTDCTIPDELDRIEVGNGLAIMSDLSFYPK